jgi:hypothetical protein
VGVYLIYLEFERKYLLYYYIVRNTELEIFVRNRVKNIC